MGLTQSSDANNNSVPSEIKEEYIQKLNKKYLDQEDLEKIIPKIDINIDDIIPHNNYKHHLPLERELKQLYIKHKNLDPNHYHHCGAYTLETWLFFETKNKEFVKEAYPIVKDIIEARKYEMKFIHEAELNNIIDKNSEKYINKEKYILDRKKLIDLYQERLDQMLETYMS